MSKIIKISRLFSVFEINLMLLLEVNSAMFWVSRSILRQLSPAFKTGKKLQKEAHKISTFIALYCCAAVALIRSMIALVYLTYLYACTNLICLYTLYLLIYIYHKCNKGMGQSLPR